MSKGGGEQNLSVALRIRPLNEDEILMGATQIAHKVQDKMVVLMDPMEDPEDVLRANRSREKKYVFDYTFDGAASQENVFKTTSQFLIPNVISGYNATVFAYGATGAGKTYTMLGTDDEPGIMARALNDLFLEMDKTSDDMAYKVTMSYLEIYNEMIRDLLNPSAGILDLREDAKGGVQVAGLSEVTARSTNEVMKMLLKGNKERTQEPTAANKTSSRSHAVLQVMIKQQNKVRNTQQEVRMGKLFMIDLAGSERAANTHNRGKRMVEGAHINRSLLALGNCINALTDQKGSKYVNYRDSKLTRLLKDALGGNCKTVMIAHISPASIHFEESRNTLVYADRAKHIKTKVRRNVTDVSFHIAQYTNIIQELREEILRLRHRLQDKTTSPKSGSPHSGANIQVVQAEVLAAKRIELNKLKEQLLISFKDQMELRKSLMELNNATMEISLETNRNQLIISEWDVERTKSARREGNDREGSKALELSGAGSDELPEPEDVKLAREELKVLHDEKHRTEKLRTTVQKELEQAKAKTRRLEETIPQRINTEDQREILNLLCKVHQLEIENTETQSACLLREFQIKRKDMVISRFRQHQNLCDQIISRQREIMKEHNIEASKDLEDLYNLYKQEREDRMLLEDSGHLSPELRLKAPSLVSNYRSILQDDPEQLGTLLEVDERSQRSRNTLSPSYGDDKIFSRRDKWANDGSLTGAWRNETSLSNGDQGSHLDNVESGKSSPSKLSHTDRTVITTGTRNIAALAAKKRSKAHNDLLNLERQFGGEPRSLGLSSQARDSYLSQSSLANHDRKYGDSVLPTIKTTSDDNLDNISTGTKHSINTDSTLPPIRDGRVGRGDNRRNRRTKGYEYGYSPQVGYNHWRPENGRTGNELDISEESEDDYISDDDIESKAIDIVQNENTASVVNITESVPPFHGFSKPEGGARPKVRNITGDKTTQQNHKPTTQNTIHNASKKSGTLTKAPSVNTDSQKVLQENESSKRNACHRVNNELTFVTSEPSKVTIDGDSDIHTQGQENLSKAGNAETKQQRDQESTSGTKGSNAQNPLNKTNSSKTLNQTSAIQKSVKTKPSLKLSFDIEKNVPKSRETKSRETLSRETRSRDTKSRAVKSRETKSREVKSRETKSRETKSREVKSRETRESKSREIKSRETRESISREVKSRETKSRKENKMKGNIGKQDVKIKSSGIVRKGSIRASRKNGPIKTMVPQKGRKPVTKSMKTLEKRQDNNNQELGHLDKVDLDDWSDEEMEEGEVLDDGELSSLQNGDNNRIEGQYGLTQRTSTAEDKLNTEEAMTDLHGKDAITKTNGDIQKDEAERKVFITEGNIVTTPTKSLQPFDFGVDTEPSVIDTTLDVSLPGMSCMGSDTKSDSGNTAITYNLEKSPGDLPLHDGSNTFRKLKKETRPKSARQSNYNKKKKKPLFASQVAQSEDSEIYTGRVKREDSVLNITGKPPTGARPTSLRPRMSFKKLARPTKTDKRAKSDTAIPGAPNLFIGSGELTPPGGKKRGAKKAGYKGNDIRVTGTPNKGQKSKKQVPTIPTYRKGDITITGFSLPR